MNKSMILNHQGNERVFEINLDFVLISIKLANGLDFPPKSLFICSDLDERLLVCLNNTISKWIGKRTIKFMTRPIRIFLI